MISNHMPNPRPLQPDAVHVVIRYLHYLLQAEHARMVWGGQLVHGHSTQPPDKVNWALKHTTVSSGCYTARVPVTQPVSVHTYLLRFHPASLTP